MKYSKDTQEEIKRLKADGLSSRKIAKELNISKSGVNDYLAKVNTNKTQVPPKVLLLDLESTPSIAAVFGRFKQNIGQDSVLKEGGSLLTACCKWLGKDEVIKLTVTPWDAQNGYDSDICWNLHNLIDEADVVIAHNLQGFDLPLLKARCLINGLPALKQVRTIDTLQVAKQLRFNSNKLDSLCSQLGIGRKLDHDGILLWLRCMQGDQEALDTMLEYNAKDVLLLEELYLALRPYDIKHPNLALFYSDDILRCNTCGSTAVEPTGNKVYTNLSEFLEYSCKDCGSRLRGRVNQLSKDKRSSLLAK